MFQRLTFSLLIVSVASSVVGCSVLESRHHPEASFSTSRTTADPIEIAETSNNPSDEIVRAQSPSMFVETRGSYPIDFPTVLRLAGADNWNVKIARARAQEAAANYCEAKNEWMPSLTMSLGYNKHEGQLQSTEGDVLTVSRNSLFAGGGAGIQNSPLNGGSGGPARMFVDFSIADAIFKPLAARQKLGAEQARQNRVFNDTMLEASLAYYELVGAQSRLAIAQTNLYEADQLATLTAAFVESGKGTSSDSSRVAVIVNNRQMALTIAESELRIASAQLATILQLDPTKLNPEQGLVATDSDPVPVTLIPYNFDLNTTIQQAQNVRCEIAEANAIAGSAQSELDAEQWRPWLPNLYLGYSGGVFGGGQGGDIPKLDGRSDLDVVVAWQMKNLGFGSRARQDQSRSRTYQRKYELKQIRDQIAEQVTTTHQRVEQYRTMVGLLNSSISQAGDGLAKNLEAIKGLEGLPLEAISSLEQLARARDEYVSAVTNFNQWQIRLLRSAGQSLTHDASLGQIANCNAGTNGCDASLPECSRCIKRPAGRPVGACGCDGPAACSCNGNQRWSPIRSTTTRLTSIIGSRSGGNCSNCESQSNVGCSSCSQGGLGLINSNSFNQSTEPRYFDQPVPTSNSNIGTPYLGQPTGRTLLDFGASRKPTWYRSNVSEPTNVAAAYLLGKPGKNSLSR